MNAILPLINFKLQADQSQSSVQFSVPTHPDIFPFFKSYWFYQEKKTKQINFQIHMLCVIETKDINLILLVSNKWTI